MVQLLWFKKVRQNLGLLFVMSLLVNVGMWLERFVIVVTSLANDFVPSSWAHYYADAVGLHALCGHVRSVPDRVPAVPARSCR